MSQEPRPSPAASENAGARTKKPRSNSTIDGEFSLAHIRDALVRQEETIIFAMIERGQYARNARTYQRGEGATLVDKTAEFPSDSFFEHFLYESEKLHARLGRYRAQDLEHAFFWNRSLPTPALSRSPAEPWGKPLQPNKINVNNEILDKFASLVIHRLAPEEDDDGHYGSTALLDITLIQALSYRIHYGKLVAEAKYRANTAAFRALIDNKDTDGIMKLLTDVAVEKKVVERVRAKAARYGAPEDAPPGAERAFKVNPDAVAEIYGDFLIPLNKIVQVQYLMERTVEWAGPLSN